MSVSDAMAVATVLVLDRSGGCGTWPINLRLKGAGIFWHEDSAEAVLLLRSYYKAGRWKNLEKQVVTAILQDAA
jgi:hypothetical protein